MQRNQRKQQPQWVKIKMEAKTTNRDTKSKNTIPLQLNQKQTKELTELIKAKEELEKLIIKTKEELEKLEQSLIKSEEKAKVKEIAIEIEAKAKTKEAKEVKTPQTKKN
jgi:hypothetical protein